MKKLTKNDFINKAITVHGNKYDYSKLVYTNSRSKVTIICKEHGEFTQNANSHILGIGCKKCGILASSNCKTKITHSYFIEQSSIVHKNFYDYSKTHYVDLKTKVTITCRDHGDFKILPSAHLHNKQGCRKCGILKNVENVQHNYSRNFVNKAVQMHGNRYNYSEVKYTTSKEKIKIECKKHGYFYQTASDHLSGKGCAKCGLEVENSSSIKLDEPAILYYVSINKGEAYKIGVTNKTIKQRFYGEKSKITVIHSWPFEKGIDAFKIEQKILKSNSEYRYKGKDLLKSGNTELFGINILNIINETHIKEIL